MFGMTLSFATAGIGQVYLERILGLGYLDTQLKIQVHFLMLLGDRHRSSPSASRCSSTISSVIAPRFEAPDRDRRPRARTRAGDRAAELGARRMACPARSHADGCATWREAPYYLPVGDEVAVFEQCHARRLAVMLKGPTGCGKTRFVEHMAWRLGRPLVTIACHDDLSASDLTGRFLIRGDDTVWQDGPLTRAARARRDLLSRRESSRRARTRSS